MTSYRKTFILLSWAIVCLLTPAYANEDNPEEIAKTYFTQRKYDQALAIWYSMVEAGHSTPGLYFNIGVAESMLHNVPKALFGYEQALRLNPLNATIKTVILEERKKIENGTIPVAPFFLNEWYKGVVTIFRPGLWSLIGLCLLGIGLLSLLIGQLANSRRHFLHPWVRRWLIASGVLCVVIAYLSYKEIYREDEAMLIEKSEIRQAAAEDSPVIRSLYPGEKIRITDKIGDWYKVELLNLDGGWIKKQHLQLVLIRKG